MYYILTADKSNLCLFAALARAVQQRDGEFNAQGLANIAWAFATSDQKDALLFATLARAAGLCIGSFNPQHLGNTAWALATAKAAKHFFLIYNFLCAVRYFRISAAWAFTVSTVRRVRSPLSAVIFDTDPRRGSSRR